MNDAIRKAGLAVDLFSQLPMRLFAYQIYANMTWLPGVVRLWLISSDSHDMTAHNDGLLWHGMFTIYNN